MPKEFGKVAMHVNAANMKARSVGTPLICALISFIFVAFRAYIRDRNINQKRHAIAAQRRTQAYPSCFSLTPLKSIHCPHNSSELLNT